MNNDHALLFYITIHFLFSFKRVLFRMSKNELDQIPDMPKGGPLQVYRDKATFNWKKMKLFLDDIEFINYRVRLIESLKLYSVFCFCF